MKKKPVKNRSTVFTVLLVVLVCIFLYSGYRLIGIVSGYLAGRQVYKETAGEFVSKNPEAESPQESVETEPESGETGEEKAEDPGPFVTTPPISINWDALLAQNPDVVGWIYSENTLINYPVLRASDNSKYLHTMVDGRYNSAGSIFMDCSCDPNLSDLVTIIYGHNMQDGSMFASLHNYVKQDYYDKHPVMWYLTPSANYRLDIYSGYVDKPDAKIYNLSTYREDLNEYLQYAAGKSNFKTMKEFSSLDIDRVLVLSTCAYEFNNARYLLAAVPVKVP